MPDAIESALEGALTGESVIGEVLIRKEGDLFVLSHRQDARQPDLQVSWSPEDAVAISKYDDAGNYRSLKTAPNLRHGWRLVLTRPADVRLALNQLSETLIHLESTTPADATLRLTGGSEGAD